MYGSLHVLDTAQRYIGLRRAPATGLGPGRYQGRSQRTFGEVIMDPGVIGVFIPIIAIVMGIGIGMLAIWSEHKRKAQLLEQNHRERMHAIEKGIELPPLPAGLIGASNGPATATAAKSLRSGIMLTLIGIVLYFAIGVVGADQAALFGLIPAAIGVANLVYAAILGKKEKAGTFDVERP
jgi:hypothetical protein